MLVYNFEILDEEKVFIRSGIITYMFDSFKWIKTFDKLKIRKNKGLFYRGSTYFEKESIGKLKKVIFSWKELFNEASENFELTGFFNEKLDEYDRKDYNKEEVIEILEKLVTLCDSAEKENKIIKHWGIKKLFNKIRKRDDYENL